MFLILSPSPCFDALVVIVSVLNTSLPRATLMTAFLVASLCQDSCYASLVCSRLYRLRCSLANHGHCSCHSRMMLSWIRACTNSPSNLVMFDVKVAKHTEECFDHAQRILSNVILRRIFHRSSAVSGFQLSPLNLGRHVHVISEYNYGDETFAFRSVVTPPVRIPICTTGLVRGII